MRGNSTELRRRWDIQTMFQVAAFGCLLLLCLRATANSVQPRLPADVTMNKGAGRGGDIIATLRLADGERLPFVIDTGTSCTLIDKSLEPKLGKCLGTTRVNSWGVKTKLNRYAAPKLYLGNTLLITGGTITTFDFRRMSSHAHHRIMGILGMDCLRHYCIQLDFEAGKMRFLDPDHLNVKNLGKAFAITFARGGRPFIHHESLAETANTNSLTGSGADNSWRKTRELPPTYALIDSGYNVDGRVGKGAIQGQKSRWAHLPKCVFDGETYTNLVVGIGKNANILGLRFLARNIVTLDFPKRVMYLKQTSVGPLIDESQKAVREAAAKAAAKSALRFTTHLKEEGQLPGWSKDDHGTATTFHFQYSPHFDSVTLEAHKNGDSSVYHYTISRTSKQSPWRLQKAWRTDQGGHIVEEYPILAK